MARDRLNKVQIRAALEMAARIHLGMVYVPSLKLTYPPENRPSQKETRKYSNYIPFSGAKMLVFWEGTYTYHQIINGKYQVNIHGSYGGLISSEF